MFESGMQQEDGPVTWEALTLPQGKETATREPAESEISDVPALVGARWKTAKKSHSFEVGLMSRGTGAKAEMR